MSAWFVLALRLMMGYAFLHAGYGKLTEAGWSAGGYLANVAATNGNPLQGAFAWMAATPWFVEFVNVAVPFGQLLIGLGVLFDALNRLAAFFGAFMMTLFYFGNWDIAHGFVNGDLTYSSVWNRRHTSGGLVPPVSKDFQTLLYMVVFLAAAALGAGRIVGLDAYIERLEVGGKALVERHAILGYILG